MAWNPSRTTALKNPISISCIVIVCIGFVVAATVERGRAYDFAAHEVLGTLAGDASSIDAVLRDELGFPSGRATTFQQGLQSRTFSQWIGRGALEEDIPDFRVLNHFHDPLADWANAGLTVLERQLGQSSVLWQQNENQDGSLVTLVLPFAQFRVGGGNWSWPDARRAFVDALTKETAEDRNAGLVDSFLTLGHLTHLIQVGVAGQTQDPSEIADVYGAAGAELHQHEVGEGKYWKALEIPILPCLVKCG